MTLLLILRLSLLPAFLFPGLFAQTQPPSVAVDMASALRRGSIKVTTNARDADGPVANLFDGRPSTSIGSPSVDPLVVTLDFGGSATVKATDFLSLGCDSKATLEAAASLADLDSKMGSYKTIFGDGLAAASGSGGRFPRPFEARVLRLTLRCNSQGGFPRLHEWELKASVRIMGWS